MQFYMLIFSYIMAAGEALASPTEVSESIPCSASSASEHSSVKRARSNHGASAASVGTASHAGSGGQIIPSVASSGSRMQSRNTFPCKKCKLVLPLEVMDPIKVGVCTKDVLSYKSLTERWSRNRSLKTWWDKQSEPQQVGWYREQHTVRRGTKRKMDVMYADKSSSLAYNYEENADRWIPYEVYLREELPKKQKSEAELLIAFRNIVENSLSHCRWERNEWCIPRWDGILNRAGHGTQQESSSSRQVSHLDNSDELRQLQQGGAKLVEQFSAQLQGIRGAQELGAEAPVCNAVPQDMPTAPRPTDVIANVVNREVQCNRYGFCGILVLTKINKKKRKGLFLICLTFVIVSSVNS